MPHPIHSVRAPARIDLAGGTLDIWPICHIEPDARTVNLAIDRHAVARVRLRDDGRYVLAATDRKVRERHADRAALAASKALPLHREIALHLAPESGVEISTRSGVPPGSGLGGSSTLVVAMMKALGAATDRRMSSARLLQVALDIEASVLGVPTGTQDHAAALFGGLSEIDYPRGGPRRRAIRTDQAALARRLVLVYTGKPHVSGTTNWEVTKRYLDGDATVRGLVGEIAAAARDLGAALRHHDLEAAASAMQAEGDARGRLVPGMTTPKIDRIGKAARAAGALGMKVCGAGGGGCCVLFVAAGKRAAVERAARAQGGEIIRFRAAARGAE